MKSEVKQTLQFFRVMVDVCMIMSAWCVAYFTRFYSFFPSPKGIPEFSLYFKLLPILAGLWLFIANSFGFYKRSHNKRSAILEALDIIPTSLIVIASFVLVTYFYEEYRYSRATVFFFAILAPFFLVAGRSIFRKILRFYQRNADTKKVLIIGSGVSFTHSDNIIHRSDFSKLEVIGAVLIGSDEDIKIAKKDCEVRKIKIIDEPKSWVDFASKMKLDSVVFALPHTHYTFLDRNLSEIADQVLDIKMIPNIARYTRFACGIEKVEGIPFIQVHESPLLGVGRVYKRALDVFGAVLALVLFGPLMLILAAAVKFSSRGPIFYRQERMGLDGKVFNILKFRSMPVDAESKTGAVWAKATDSRATGFGSFMRKTSLDELPQLFNVLSGSMSMVGPRPERPVFVNEFRQNVPGYMLRHKVKSGITGWAQINGWRGNTSIEKRIECDLYYIQNWSLILDIRILFLTIFKGFISKNAY